MALSSHNSLSQVSSQLFSCLNEARFSPSSFRLQERAAALQSNALVSRTSFLDEVKAMDGKSLEKGSKQ